MLLKASDSVRLQHIDIHIDIRTLIDIDSFDDSQPAASMIHLLCKGSTNQT